MSTKQIHPTVRRSEQFRKFVFRCLETKGVPHHTRNWWKAWRKRIEKETIERRTNMKRFLALTLMVAIMVVSFGAVRTAAVGMEVPAENIDADYSGELLDEPLWEINFFLDGQVMFSAVSEESLLDYTIDTIAEMMNGYWDESECLYNEQIINVYYTKGE